MLALWTSQCFKSAEVIFPTRTGNVTSASAGLKGGWGEEVEETESTYYFIVLFSIDEPQSSPWTEMLITTSASPIVLPHLPIVKTEKQHEGATKDKTITCPRQYETYLG